MMTSDEDRDVLMRHRRALLDELAATCAALDDLRVVRTGGHDDDEHDPDGAPLSGEWSRLEGNRRATEVRLADIDRALADLEAGTYGVCVHCGRPIPPGRLEARPATRHCVDCSSRAG